MSIPNSPPSADRRCVADQIKRAFGEMKAEQQGKPYRPHERFRKLEFWERAAEVCEGVGADPHSFCRAAFLYCIVPGGPFPQNIASAAGARWYREYEQIQGKQKGANAYQLEVRALFANVVSRRRFFPNLGLREFLLDGAQEIPAFVVYLIAAEDPEITALKGREAGYQLKSNAHLLRALEAEGFPEPHLERIMSLC